MKLLIIFFSLLLIVPSLFATIIDVPDDKPTIQEGLNAASEGDTVLVQPGTYIENIFWPSVNGIKLVSAGDTTNTVIDGSNISSVIYISANGNIDSTTLIKGFKITNGGNVSCGGGIYCNKASPKIEKSILFRNTASINGGGLYCNSYSCPIIMNVQICVNSSNSCGGGIYCSDHSSPKLNKVIINENIAVLGGAFYCNSYSNPILTSAIISKNSSGNGGGMFCENNSCPSIIDSHFEENTSNYGGGISCTSNSNTTMHNVEFLNNSAFYGGGMFFINSSPTLLDVEVNGNSSGAGYGGGIHLLNNSNAIIENSKIINNSGKYGGAVYCELSSPIFSNIIVRNNSSSFGGGFYCVSSVFNSDSGICIEKGKINNNISDYGGGLYLNDYSKVNIANSIIYSNVANQNGGGIYSYNYSTTNLIHSILAENISISSGGGIYCSGSDLNLKYLAIIRNFASNIGGGVYIKSNSNSILSSCSISENICSEKGDGIFSSSSLLTKITQSNINMNGLAIFNENNSQFIQATENWWGDSSGPYHPAQNTDGLGDSVNLFVNILPFLTEPNIDAPPIPVQNLQIISIGNDFIDLSWNPSPLGDLSGYKICYKTDTTEFFYTDTIDVGNVTSYSLAGLSAGSTYYIGAICYDTDGNESWFSNEVTETTRYVGNLVQSSKQISFGYVKIGESKNIPITLSSSGNDTLRISNIISSNSSFVSKLVTATVAPNSSVDDTICFSPTKIGIDSASIVIFSNAASSPDTIFAYAEGALTSVSTEPHIPIIYTLDQNYPNPFNPVTTISYQLPKSTYVKLSIYDITGRLIETLLNENKNAGYYSVEWNSNNVGSGIYFYRIEAGDFSEVKKCLVVK